MSNKAKAFILGYGISIKARKSPIIKIYYKLYDVFFRIFDIFTKEITINRYFKKHSIYKLQLAAGMNNINGWLNSDINPRRGTIYLNACNKFPFDDNIFHYIFNEHFIEHVPYRVGAKIIRECYRILRPGGKIRISTPDLNFLIQLYCNNKTELQREYIRWAADVMFTDDLKGIYEDTFVINNYFYSWGHKFIYDEKSLVSLLHNCGFVNINRYNIGESDDDNLRNLEHHGFIIGEKQNRFESMAVEATKPLV